MLHSVDRRTESGWQHVTDRTANAKSRVIRGSNPEIFTSATHPLFLTANSLKRVRSSCNPIFFGTRRSFSPNFQKQRRTVPPFYSGRLPFSSILVGVPKFTVSTKPTIQSVDFKLALIRIFAVAGIRTERMLIPKKPTSLFLLTKVRRYAKMIFRFRLTEKRTIIEIIIVSREVPSNRSILRSS